MDELYRGYRISIKQSEGWSARITHVRGPSVPLTPRSTRAEGPDICLSRAREMVDRYVAFLSRGDDESEPG